MGMVYRGGCLILATLSSCVALAQEGLVSYRSLSPDVALELARASLEACRAAGYQVAVSVTDRFGSPQVVLRDRFAGPHTLTTATAKAWTSISFRTNTSELIALSQPGQPQAGIRQLPNVVVLGGGAVIESAGTTVGAVGVSGAPGGPEDESCAKAGIQAVREKLEL
ncbi:conserved protein of unknown function precursor, DUF336 [Methylorubrum extorquens DM4]|uniref:Heme-binding protein n=1 Tax=Methylorubrum extorquens (strain DSM 6343 / CIP 106787 / DM4) TaxID=661410 RepID=C7CBN3_METED|nr:conserved protein of unknown function precursor, DUF336 [Methylorubrum extorquens DM4]